MGTFSVKTVGKEQQMIKLSEIQGMEDVITLSRIETKNAKDLYSLGIRVKKEFSDVDFSYTPIIIHPLIVEDKSGKNPNANVNHKIVDTNISSLEINSQSNDTIEYLFHFETLADKLKKIKEKEIKERTNIAEEVTKWRTSVNQLCRSEIQKWLEPYRPNIDISFSPKQMKEEITEPYTIDDMTIKPIGGKTIQLSPVGTFVIGAHGRIDIFIQDYGKKIMLVLRRDDTGKDKWLMVFDKDISHATEFTKAALLNLLDEVTA